MVGEKLAYVLSGGTAHRRRRSVSEQYLLDLEREAFLSLCGNPKTQERMQHMLKTREAVEELIGNGSSHMGVSHA